MTKENARRHAHGMKIAHKQRDLILDDITSRYARGACRYPSMTHCVLTCVLAALFHGKTTDSDRAKVALVVALLHPCDLCRKCINLRIYFHPLVFLPREHTEREESGWVDLTESLFGFYGQGFLSWLNKWTERLHQPKIGLIHCFMEAILCLFYLNKLSKIWNMGNLD